MGDSETAEAIREVTEKVGELRGEIKGVNGHIKGVSAQVKTLQVDTSAIKLQIGQIETKDVARDKELEQQGGRLTTLEGQPASNGAKPKRNGGTLVSFSLGQPNSGVVKIILYVLGGGAGGAGLLAAFQALVN